MYEDKKEVAILWYTNEFDSNIGLRHGWHYVQFYPTSDIFMYDVLR
jgi:hypothetical protein